HIDMNSGRQILRITAAANAILTIFRPFVGNAGSALAVNVANEAVTVGYRMPYMKGMYAAADDLPGLRIVYLVSMEVIGNIAKGTVWFMLAILAMGIGPRTAMTVGFAIAMVASLVVMTETFKALKPRDIIKHHEQKIPAPSLG
ncbi:MAG: rane protein of unknown function, partial [Candidatus Saccharibacteria bacterium]|nr:rane protein of unknown function [Candidatus Saccharibacteria bacterium]